MAKIAKKGQVRPVKQGQSSEQIAVLAGIDPYPFAKEAAETGGFIKAQHLGDGLYTQPGLCQQRAGFFDPQLELKLVRRAAISGPEHAQEVVFRQAGDLCQFFEGIGIKGLGVEAVSGPVQALM